MGISFGDGRWYDNEYEQVADRHQQQPLRLTITPHMDAGESETGSSQGGLEEPKDIHIIRHGTTEENEEDKIRGTQDDVKLSDEGRKHALEAAEELRSKGIESLVTSPLARAKETSQIIGKELGIPVTVNDKLKTWNVGNFEGKPCEGNNDTLQDYAENKPDEKVPGGESYNEFKDRAFEGIREAILANKDKKLGIVTHHMVESSLEGWEKTGQDNPSLDLSKLFNDTDQPGSVRKMTMQPDSTIMKEYKPTFRDVLRGWLRGTNPSPQRAQIVDQLLGHTEAGEQSDLHNLNIGSLVNMQPEDIVGTNEGMFVAPSLGKKLFAQGLLKQGLSSEKVKAMTGVERGAEGKLRQEISDLPSRMKAVPDPYGKYKLSQILDHPDLYKVYPELKDVDVAYNHNMGRFTDARMNIDANTIELGSHMTDPFDIHDALLHELQHWIQHKEGFAFNVPDDAPASFVQAYKSNMRKVNDPLTVKQRIYIELAAEVEARNTQKRAGMTDEQRRASLASSTEDVSRSRQLIFDEKGNRINTSPSMTKEPSKVFGLPAEVYEQRMKDVLTNQPELRQVPYGVDSEYIRSLSYDDYIKMLNHSDKDYGKMLKEHPDKNSIDNALELWRERNPGKNPDMSRPIMSEEEAKYLVEKGGSLKGYNLRHTNPNRPKGGSKKGGPGRPRGPEWFREEMEQTLEKELLQNK